MDRTLLSDALTSLDVALFLKDMNGRYLTINSAGADIIGRPVRSIIGRDDFTLFSKQSAAVMRKRDLSIIAGGFKSVASYDSVASLNGHGDDILFHSIKATVDDGCRRLLLGLSFVSKPDQFANDETQLLCRELIKSQLPALLRYHRNAQFGPDPFADIPLLQMH